MAQNKTPKNKKPSTLKIKIIKPVAGRFGLSDMLGSVVSKPYNQATEMIDLGYAVKVK